MNISNIKEILDVFNNTDVDCKKYTYFDSSNLGSEKIKDVTEALKKMIPKKPNSEKRSEFKNDVYYYQCPECRKTIRTDVRSPSSGAKSACLKYNFCPWCGTAIDWSN